MFVDEGYGVIFNGVAVKNHCVYQFFPSLLGLLNTPHLLDSPSILNNQPN